MRAVRGLRFSRGAKARVHVVKGHVARTAQTLSLATRYKPADPGTILCAPIG
jgi:hypothetical protein